MDNFFIDVYDSATKKILKKTTIGDKTYVEAEAPREFYVTLTVKDPNVHKKLNPKGHLNGSISIDGKDLGSSKSFKDGATTVTFKHKDGRALTFTAPQQQWYHDAEDARRAKEENKSSKIGVIEASFSQVERLNKQVDRKGSGGMGAATVKATKKCVDQPNVGITVGRVITQVGKLNKSKTLYKFGTLTVHCQSALCISMLKANHDGVEFDAEAHQEVAAPALVKNEDGNVPVVKDEAGASSSSSSGSAAGKKRAVLEIDLTNDDSDSDSDDDNEDAVAAVAEDESNK